MNWKGNRKDAELEGPPPTPFRLDAARMEEEIRRLPEEPFAPLRERVDHAGRLSMQETADACQTVLSELQERIKKMNVETDRLNRKADETHDKAHRAFKQISDEILRHTQATAEMVSILEQLDGKPQQQLPAPKNAKPRPAPASENEDATK